MSSVENKIFRAVGIISKLRHYLPTCAILQLYYSLYGLVMWGSFHKSKLKKVLSLQNKVVKFISGGLLRNSATPFYSQPGILKLPGGRFYALRTNQNLRIRRLFVLANLSKILVVLRMRTFARMFVVGILCCVRIRKSHISEKSILQHKNRQIIPFVL